MRAVKSVSGKNKLRFLDGTLALLRPGPTHGGMATSPACFKGSRALKMWWLGVEPSCRKMSIALMSQ